jgi:hypothetical protein
MSDIPDRVGQVWEHRAKDLSTICVFVILETNVLTCNHKMLVLYEPFFDSIEIVNNTLNFYEGSAILLENWVGYERVA